MLKLHNRIISVHLELQDLGLALHPRFTISVNMVLCDKLSGKIPQVLFEKELNTVTVNVLSFKTVEKL